MIALVNFFQFDKMADKRGKFFHKGTKQATTKLKSQQNERRGNKATIKQNRAKNPTQREKGRPGGYLQKGALEPTNHCAPQ
jgi:hypothetical protein